jgi:uncharacterized integral membrane protein
MLYVIVAIIAVSVAVFTLQKTGGVTVTLLVWRIGEMPLAAVILFAFAAGIVLAGAPLWIQRWRLRSQLRVPESFPSSRGPGASRLAKTD